MLSDPQKKRIFDQTGSDPTSRINNASAASGGSQAVHSLEDQGLQIIHLKMTCSICFGGGGGPRGSPFASGPTFTFGGNGFTFQSYGNGALIRS